MDLKLFFKTILILTILFLQVVCIILSYNTLDYQLDTQITALENQREIIKLHNTHLDNTFKDAEYQQKITDQLADLNKPKKPTEKDVKNMLQRINVVDRLWEDKYNCVDYTDYVINYLYDIDVFSCVGYFETIDTAHSFVVIDTIEGVLYYEPQDNVYYPTIIEKGFDFCNYLNWYYDFDCKIIKFSNCLEGRVI